MHDSNLKQDVYQFWQEASCGERLHLAAQNTEGYRRQAEERYRLEPYISGFARFEDACGKDVLEIGLGLGADHQRWAEAKARLTGVDITERAVDHTRRRLAALNLASNLIVGDAERLPFPDNSFDIVYSWGVIHHTPDTPRAASEIVRVLRPGGRFAVMIYNRHSLVGAMLWLRYAFLKGRPRLSLDAIYSQYLESPGTKAYRPAEGAALFEGAVSVRVRSVLTHGDLLASGAGQRHRGPLLSAARRIWPRAIVKRFFADRGLFLLIDGHKPPAG